MVFFNGWPPWSCAAPVSNECLGPGIVHFKTAFLKVGYFAFSEMA
jgi:hypothetical protein